MMDVSRHRSVDTLRGYVCDAEIFKDQTLSLQTATLRRPPPPDRPAFTHTV